MSGKLADNLVLFAQLLRRAGMSIGAGQVIDAVRAVAAVGVRSRDDVFAALSCTLTMRRGDREVFAQAFDLFFRDPFAQNEALALLLPHARVPESRSSTLRRVREAWHAPTRQAPRPFIEEEAELDAAMTFAPTEVSRDKDFEHMSTEEIAAARLIVAGMDLSVRPIPTRRFERAAHGSAVDFRRSLRAASREPDAIPLLHRRRRRRPPAVVAICDVSGSMDRYSRMLLAFLHALAHARDRVHSFVFGTRLTHASRALRERDVDLALDALGKRVGDWAGGTRIGQCLRTFNREWARRVLGQGAVVLLITDGLDRDPGVDLAFEAERLRRSCRRLIWLNPLLRYERFEPLARGIVELLPHVHEHRPIHNLHAMSQLAELLTRRNQGNQLI